MSGMVHRGYLLINKCHSVELRMYKYVYLLIADIHTVSFY